MGASILRHPRPRVNRPLGKIEQVGERFKSSKWNKWFARYRCFCGNEFTALCADVIAGRSRSCGCSRRSVGMDGSSEHPLYRTWKHIIDRCTNPNARQWKDYGGRGIAICSEWRLSFAAFAAYIELVLGDKPTTKHTLDRIENDSGYEPGNVRWATRKVQSRNQRRIAKDSRGIPVIELAEMAGVVRPATARDRVNKQGWSAEEAANTAPRFARYQQVVSAAVVPGRYSGTDVLELRLACGCTVKRQSRSYRPVPLRAKCDLHKGVANA